MEDQLRTRESLLGRLRDNGAEADWEQFYKQYRWVIISFCRKQGLDEFSAQDVLQETMVLLMRKLPEFYYDRSRGKFRNWLLALVAGKISDARKRAARANLATLSEVEAGEAALVAKGEPVDACLEKAWMHATLEQALLRVQLDPRVKKVTFEIFKCCFANAAPVNEIARQFNLTENAVYQVKNRMMRRLREEVEAMGRWGERDREVTAMAKHEAI